MISVVMPVYNAEKYIEDAIESILAQTYSDFEFIIINDASTDSTGAIIESYKDPRIIVINNETNLGITKSLNIGFEKAKGAYIARMDADDISVADRFEKQVDFLNNNDCVDVCGTWYERIGDSGGVAELPADDQSIKDTLFFYNCIAHPTVMLRADRFRAMNIKYDQYFVKAQDYELWCRESHNLKFANIPEVLLKYRIHRKQSGIQNKIIQKNAAEEVVIISLKKIGVELEKNELKIYFQILGRNLDVENTKQLYEYIAILDLIAENGSEKYGQVFLSIIREYMAYVAEQGVISGVFSIRLYFSFLRKWKVWGIKKRIIYFAKYMLNFMVG